MRRQWIVNVCSLGMLGGFAWWITGPARPGSLDPSAGLLVTESQWESPAPRGVLSPPRIEVILNGRLLLRGVVLHRKAGIPWLTFPGYQAPNGMEYPELSLATYHANTTLARQLVPAPPHSQIPAEGGQRVVSPPRRLPFRVTHLELAHRRSPTSPLRAFATVTFNEELEVKVRVMQSHRGLWIAWPARREADHSWIRQCEFLDYPFRRSVERILFAAYRELAEEAGLQGLVVRS